MNNEDLLSEVKLAKMEKGNLEVQLNKGNIRLEGIGKINTVSCKYIHFVSVINKKKLIKSCSFVYVLINCRFSNHECLN